MSKQRKSVVMGGVIFGVVSSTVLGITHSAAVVIVSILIMCGILILWAVVGRKGSAHSSFEYIRLLEYCEEYVLFETNLGEITAWFDVTNESLDLSDISYDSPCPLTNSDIIFCERTIMDIREFSIGSSDENDEDDIPDEDDDMW